MKNKKEWIANTTDPANNVILFPGMKSVFEPAPPSLEELRQRNVEMVVQEMTDFYIQLLKKHNFQVPEPCAWFLKDTTLINDAVRSSASRIADIPHPLQNLSDKIFDVTETEDEMSIGMIRFGINTAV
jgi:hypothetical protein